MSEGREVGIGIGEEMGGGPRHPSRLGRRFRRREWRSVWTEERMRELRDHAMGLVSAVMGQENAVGVCVRHAVSVYVRWMARSVNRVTTRAP